MSRLLFGPLNESDKPICEVEGGKEDGTVLWLNEEKCCQQCSPKCGYRRCCSKCLGPEEYRIPPMKEYKIADAGKMKVIPKTNGSQHGFIFGSSGSGKSWFTSEYVEMYQRVFPQNPVYLVSYVDEDSSIDKIQDLIRIPIEDITSGKISGKTIADSLIIFDDVDALQQAPEKKEEEQEASVHADEKKALTPKVIFGLVETLRDQLLTTGRHHNVSVIVTSHLGANFNHTKVPINESNFVVVFPKGGNASQIDRIVRNYSGLTGEQKKKLMALPSRWVMLYKSYPSYVVHERGCYLI